MATTNQLLPILRSDLMARLLTRLLVAGVHENQRELATALDVSPASLSVAAKIARSTGVVDATMHGRATYLSANRASPLYEPLRQLLAITTGTPILLGRALSSVSGIRAAYIFGSWAQRDSGIPGRPPNDIDVLVLGEATSLDVARACAAATRELSREVNPIVKPLDAWDDPNDHFILRLRAEPLVEIPLAPSDGSPDMAGSAALTRDGQAGDEWFSLFNIS